MIVYKTAAWVMTLLPYIVTVVLAGVGLKDKDRKFLIGTGFFVADVLMGQLSIFIALSMAPMLWLGTTLAVAAMVLFPLSTGIALQQALFRSGRQEPWGVVFLLALLIIGLSGVAMLCWS